MTFPNGVSRDIKNSLQLILHPFFETSAISSNFIFGACRTCKEGHASKRYKKATMELTNQERVQGVGNFISF